MGDARAPVHLQVADKAGVGTVHVPAVPPAFVTHRAPDMQPGPWLVSQAAPSAAYALHVPDGSKVDVNGPPAE